MITTAWASSTAATVTVLAAISPRRDSGVAPSRFSTPYLRPTPVAIAWLVNAVDSTASARMPGARKSILVPGPKLTSGSALNAISSPPSLRNRSMRPTKSTTSCSAKALSSDSIGMA